MAASPVAYVNGRFVPAERATIPLADAGFVLGATVTEQLRSFGGQLFRLDEHLARLTDSLRIVDVQPPESMTELRAAAQELAAHNHALLAAGDDLGLAVLVTPGDYAAFSSGGPSRPLVCMHAYPLPFHLWADKYRTGQALVTTGIEQVPSNCWPAELKCRSRMHYYLADLAARRVDSQARALLKDAAGNVGETATANVVLFMPNEGLVSPPSDTVLPGVSLAFVRELATELELPWTERRLQTGDFFAASEAILTSTPNCLLAATSLDGRPVGAGLPGPTFQKIIERWGERAGLDIVAQAARFAAR